MGIELLVVLGILIVSMSIHEAMHAFASHWLGDDTAHLQGRLTLNPLKHIDLLTTVLVPFLLISQGLPPIFAAKPVPFNPLRIRYEEFGVALVGLAGPLTNLVLAVLGSFVLRLGGFDPGSLSRDIWLLFMQINIGMFVFNMLPIPPLDGSRVLYAFAPEPLQRLMEQIEGIGIFGIMIILFLLLPVIGPIVTEANRVITAFLL